MAAAEIAFLIERRHAQPACSHLIQRLGRSKVGLRAPPKANVLASGARFNGDPRNVPVPAMRDEGAVRIGALYAVLRVAVPAPARRGAFFLPSIW
jgi:hypothetical protein